MIVEIVKAGMLATVQDLGRTGFRESGVPVGGAADPFAARVANALAGNDPGAAVLEITMGGLHLRFSDRRVLAWCGGDYRVIAGSALVPAGRACSAAAGSEVRADLAGDGCRAWLAISGGIDTAPVLGSRSTDLRGAFGGFHGRALRDGDALPLANSSAAPALDGLASFGAPAGWAQPFARPEILCVTPGADLERFSPESRERFFAEEFVVTADADRMGARLDGPALERIDADGDLPSGPVAPGTLQIPPNGKPILLLADCQTLGGYPKFGHVIAADLPRAAQLRPGDRVRFAEIPLAEAHRLWLERESAWRRFLLGLSLRA